MHFSEAQTLRFGVQSKINFLNRELRGLEKWLDWKSTDLSWSPGSKSFSSKNEPGF